LLPAGYGEIGFLTISGSGYSASLATPDYSKAVATDKATAVEQFSLEQLIILLTIFLSLGIPTG